jgi:hypothetical protein
LIGVEDLTNVVVEAVNSRDPELLEQAELPSNTEALKESIQTMDERWPRLMMTRGDLHGRPVGVIWMPDRNERYRRVAHMEIVPDEDAPKATLVEGPEPDLVIEDPPGRTVAEWESSDDDVTGGSRWI